MRADPTDSSTTTKMSSSAKTGKRPLRSLSAHEKLEAIRRVHDGESKASVARDIGVPESTLRGWCKNENKISYLSRQSSPETDDPSLISEPKEKRLKMDIDPVQPFNLSLKCAPNIYSPSSEVRYNSNPLDYSKSDAKTPENLSLLKSAETPKSAAQMSEREKNRAELARLSVELGLNRPEMFVASTLNSGQGFNELAANLNLLGLNQHQWSGGNGLLNLMMQQQLQQQGNHKKITTAPADSSANLVTSSALKSQSSSAKLPKEQQSMEEYIKCWLKAHEVLLASSGGKNGLGGGSLPVAAAASSTAQNGVNGASSGNVCQTSWFWNWYKELTTSTGSQNHQEKPILYQQLTKDENLSGVVTASEKPAITKSSSSKGRSVLDNLLLINNINNNLTNNNRKEDKTDSLSPSEALEHGEKFMKWLETCSEPSVTAVQIMQFRTLLNNVKLGADRRRNGDLQHSKTKVKRK